MDDAVTALRERGYVWIPGGFSDAEEAFACAQRLVDMRCGADGASMLAAVGDFVVPPFDGGESRDFQTLHFDFGLPLEPKVEHDVGRYTALYIPSWFGAVSAVTRLVPLAALLRQRAWPSPTDLLARVIAYGKTHGAWDDARGYVEGSLARLVEAAAGTANLQSVKANPGFLCGMEFDTLVSEIRFFRRHSLSVEDVEVEVPLSPGELLLFDNLSVAHGRRGARRPGELRQRIFGHKALDTSRQREVRARVLAAFGDSHEDADCREAQSGSSAKASAGRVAGCLLHPRAP